MKDGKPEEEKYQYIDLIIAHSGELNPKETELHIGSIFYNSDHSKIAWYSKLSEETYRKESRIQTIKVFLSYKAWGGGKCEERKQLS